MPPTPLAAEKEWQQFFELAPIHESARSFFKSFVGPWPTDVRPGAFAGDAYPSLIERLQNHLNGPYPVESMRRSDDPPRPNYVLVGGKIARSCSPFIDMMICGVIPRHEMTSQEPHIVVWRLIKKHSSSSLAKLIFSLPLTNETSKAATDGKAGVLVIQDLKIQVYKGIENVIFGSYEDLPEGGQRLSAYRPARHGPTKSIRSRRTHPSPLGRLTQLTWIGRTDTVVEEAALGVGMLTGVNYIFGLTTTISPDQRQLLCSSSARGEAPRPSGF